MNFFINFNKRIKDKKNFTHQSKCLKGHIGKSLRFEQLEPREMLSVLTWTGDGGANNGWNNAVNWTGGGLGYVPHTGDSLIFGSGGSTSINDMPTNPWLNSIEMYGGYTIYASDANHPIQIMGGGVQSRLEGAGNVGTIYANISLLGDVPIQIDSGCSLTINGKIVDSIYGSTSVTKTEGGKLTLNGANTYSGGTTISAGTLQAGSGFTSARMPPLLPLSRSFFDNEIRMAEAV
jgi:autotransporter-associated beta strand protein